MKNDFDYYEIGIVERLQIEYGYAIEEARNIVNEYRDIIELIGGYPTVSDYALYFNRAKKSGRTKEAWVKHIMSTREES